MLADRLAGCLVGQALGDALGFVVEGQDPADAARYAAMLFTGDRLIAPRHYTPGQYSDDTQQARELALSLAERGRWEPADFARRLATLFAEERDVGAGPGTRGAAQRLARGVPWQDAGAPEDYAGNGAAMRAALLGLLYESGELARVCTEQARVTHRNPDCAMAALAVATAAGAPARGTRPELPAALSHRVAELLPLQPADAARRLSSWRLDPAVPPEYPGVSSHVLPSVCWALYAALRSPDDYPTAIRTAIAIGGDTDTTGAIAGALVGARIGLRNLPHALATQVHDQGTWDYDALVALATRLTAL